MHRKIDRMEDLLKKIQGLRVVGRIEPELEEKIEQAQALLSELYSRVEKRMQKVVQDYSFLSRDHLFFDGDHEHHSGAV